MNSTEISIRIKGKVKTEDHVRSYSIRIDKSGLVLELTGEEIRLVPSNYKHALLSSLPDVSVSGLGAGFLFSDNENDGGAYLKGKLSLGDHIAIEFPEESSEENVQTGSVSNIDSAGGITKKIQLNKSFGPVKLNNIGLSAENLVPKFTVDASFSIAGLTFRLIDLGAGFPLGNFPVPSPALSGLALSYKKGVTEIGGAFLKIGEGVNFVGSALVSTKAFNLTAVGGYDATGVSPSFFLYAIYKKALGGPSFFYVTGLAGGLGINRKLRIPEIDEIDQFPLVKAALDDGYNPDKDQLLSSLSDHIPASPGSFWAAVGVRFTSFKLLESFALLTLSLGEEFALHMLGVSTLKIGDFVYTRLLLKASFLPEQGFLGIEGRLASNSYVFQKNCRLSGGFAFFQWFSGASKGDFVVSWGGYHPDYNKPSHYPTIPRLSINWPVNSSLQVKGSAYMAITPGALMAGGRLEAVWEKGSIRAWFTLDANFLILWKPFSYTASLNVTIGASFRVKILFVKVKVSISVRVGVRIWGPELAGRAVIDLKLISFTIPFGSTTRKPVFIPTEEFRNELLPKELLTINVTEGLLKDIAAEDRTAKNNNTTYDWILDPQLFKIEVDCAIPVKEIVGKNTSGADFHIRPSNITNRRISSTLTTTLTGEISNVTTNPIIKRVPRAMWGIPGETTVPKDDLMYVQSGIEIIPGPTNPGFTREYDLDELLFDTKLNKLNEHIWRINSLLLINNSYVDKAIIMAINREERRSLRAELLNEISNLQSIHVQVFTPAELSFESLINYQTGRFTDFPGKYKISDKSIL